MTRRDLRFAALFGFASAALFFLPLLAGRTLFAGDILYSFQPWLSYAAQSLQSGRIPLWNPYSACGEPFLANPQTLIFFPAAALFWMFPFAKAYSAFLFLNQWLLWTAAYLATGALFPAAGRAARLLAATAAAWGGFMAVSWEFPSMVGTIPLIVLAAALAWKGRWPALGLAFGLMLLGGYTPFACYGALWAALAAAFSARGGGGAAGKRMLAFAACAAAGGLLAAVQVLPAWEAARESLRTAIGAAEAKAHLLAPAHLLRFVLPELFDKIALPFSKPAFGAEYWPVQRNWLTTFFLGSAPLALAATALTRPRSRAAAFCAASAALAVLFACGVEPLFGLARAVVPGFAYMTHFSNAMLVAALALALLAADGYAGRAERPNALLAVWAVLALIAGFAAASGQFRTAALRAALGLAELTPEQHAFVARRAALAFACFAVTGGLAAFRPRTGPLLIFFTALELLFFSHGLHPSAPGDFFRRAPVLAAGLSGSPERLAVHPDTVRGHKPMSGETLVQGYQSLRQAVYPNVNVPYRASSAWGYEVFPSKRFVEFRRSIPAAFAGPQIDYLSIGTVLSARELGPPLRLLAQAPHALLYRNETALPPATRAERIVVLEDPADRLAYLSSRWDPAREIVLESAAASPSETRGPDPEAAFAAGRIELKGMGAGWISVNQVHYAGWKAYVSGAERPLARANHAFMGLDAPDGEWTAVLLYRPTAFAAGTLISLGVLLAAGAWAAKRAAEAAATRA